MKLLFILLTLFASLQATKVSEITKVVGVRENQLIGYSLVVGLNKTGDGTTSVVIIAGELLKKSEELENEDIQEIDDEKTSKKRRE